MENYINVRTDIINPYTYLEIELNYKELLITLDKCGGYALYQQIYKFYNGRSKGYREIKKLEKLLLVGSEQFNNNKYIYLKVTALKYLKYLECGEVTTNINRQVLKPSFRPLMNSIYSFEHYLHNKDFITTDISNQVLSQIIEQLRKILKENRIPNIHLVRIEKDANVKALKTKLKIMGDRNAIYLKEFKLEQEFSKSLLKFIWFDFDLDTQENTVLKVIRLISKLLNGLGTKNNLNCCQFSLEIITLGESRKKSLENLMKNAFKSIEKKNNYFAKKQVYADENPIISGVKDISFKIYVDIEKYIKITSKGDSEFSFADGKTVERLEQLKNITKE